MIEGNTYAEILKSVNDCFYRSIEYPELFLYNLQFKTRNYEEIDKALKEFIRTKKIKTDFDFILKKTREVVKRAQSRNIPLGHCHYCKKPIKNKRRKKFCNDNCKYHNRFYTVPKYRNEKYMRIYYGTSPGGGKKGQGRRSGGLVKGSMSAYLPVFGSPVPLNIENIERSMLSETKGIVLANDVSLYKEDALLLIEYLKKNTHENKK